MNIYTIGALEGLAVFAVAIGGYLIWDRRRYRGSGGASERFRPTEEVFQDPVTGHRTRVWEDPNTGQRHYREEQ